jgi:hypothetical protein
LLAIGAASASADILLNQPLVFSDGRTSQVFAPNTGFITWDRIQLAQNSYVNQVSWTGGFFASGPTPPTPDGTNWVFQVASDSGSGAPGTVTDSVTVPFSAVTLQAIGTGTLGGFAAGFYQLSVNLPGTLFITGGTPQWFTVYVEGNGPSAFAWVSGTGGDGVSKQLNLSNGVYSSYTDRALTLYGTAAVPEPGEILLLSGGILLAAGVHSRNRRRAVTTRA